MVNHRKSLTYPESREYNKEVDFSICLYIGKRNNFVPIGKITFDLKGYMIYEECLNNNWSFFVYGLSPKLVHFNSQNELGKWKHFVGIFDGTHLITYVNGVLKNKVSVVGTILHSNENLQFGKYSTSNNFFDGLINNVRIYNRALSESEIQDLYNEPDPVNTPKANAGTDQTVKPNTLVTLDGSASRNATSYSWTMASRPDGSTATLSDKTATTPTFTADLDGEYIISLVVSEGNENSESDTVTINDFSCCYKAGRVDQAERIHHWYGIG